MRVIVVEDEQVAQQLLCDKLKQVDSTIEILATIDSVEECVEWFQCNTDVADAVFMDIHLADGSAFRIFEQVSITTPVIFTTAYNEYALKAFEVNCVDYLLKPIQIEHLQRAIGKLQGRSVKAIDGRLVSLLYSSIVEEAQYKKNLLIPIRDKLVPLAVSSIHYIKADAHQALLVTQKGEYLIDSSLDTLQKQLSPNAFFRINRQYLVARSAVRDLSVWFV